MVHTDQYDAYHGVIPAERHKAITKKARKTNHIERFNNTLRQRVSRLVRETLSFSKILENHIGAIKFFQIPPDLVVEFQRIDIIEVI
jgi:insertion element IS1 protein InsB